MVDPLSEMPGYLLRRASQAALADVTGRLAPLGVRPTEASILTLIARNPDVTQSDIGNHLGIQRANMTPIVARLEEAGWLRRAPLDGRSQALALTDAGQALQARIWAVVEQYEATLIAAVPVAHRAHVLPVLAALWRAED